MGWTDSRRAKRISLTKEQPSLSFTAALNGDEKLIRLGCSTGSVGPALVIRLGLNSEKGTDHCPNKLKGSYTHGVKPLAGFGVLMGI